MKRGLRIMFYDISERRPLGWTWRFGAWLYKLLGWFDAVRGVHSWAEALAWLESVSRGKKIDDVRFWGHGHWGRAYIGGGAITHRAVENPKSRFHQMLLDLVPRFHPGSTIWFRTCGTVGGVFGHRFATAWSRFFNCRVAGQTYVIAYWHSGTQYVESPELPDWPQSQGVTADDQGKPKMARSHRNAPRTIRFMQRKLPPKD